MIELVLRIGFSLLIILGLMWALAKVARRPLAGKGGAAMSVVARQQLTRNSSVALVRVVDRAFVLGVTDGQVTMLGETELAAVERAMQEPGERRDAVALDADKPIEPAVRAGALDGSLLSPKTWSGTVNFLRDRTARR